jgi:hypothetical protein
MISKLILTAIEYNCEEKMNKKRAAIILVFFLVLLSCETKPPEKAYKFVITMFDLSESTAKKDIRTAYVNGFRKVMDSLNQGDILVAACITEKSIQQMQPVVDFKYPKFKPKTDNILLSQSEKKKFDEEVNLSKQEAIKNVEELLLGSDNRPKIIKTDIMSSLALAADMMKRYVELRRILVVFSDMIEDSDNYNFERINLTDAVIDEIIEKEKKADRIPDLGGVEIYIIGPQAKNYDKYNSIKKFWSKYFKESKANLVEYTGIFMGLKE